MYSFMVVQLEKISAETSGSTTFFDRLMEPFTDKRRQRQRAELARSFEMTCEATEAELKDLMKHAEAVLASFERLGVTRKALNRLIIAETAMVEKERDDLASPSVHRLFCVLALIAGPSVPLPLRCVRWLDSGRDWAKSIAR